MKGVFAADNEDPQIVAAMMAIALLAASRDDR